MTTRNRTNHVGAFEAHLKAADDEVAKMERLLAESRLQRTKILMQLEYAKASALRKLWLRMVGRRP